MSFTPGFHPDPKKESLKPKRPRVKIGSIQKETSRLIQEADRLFSIYIRSREADQYGMVRCFTCGTRATWKVMQCGHFVGRANFSTRWHDENCQIQCQTCNVIKHGNLAEYAKNLDLKYGEGTADELRALSRLIQRMNENDLRKLIVSIKSKIHPSI
jgi:hypothetical protein